MKPLTLLQKVFVGVVNKVHFCTTKGYVPSKCAVWNKNWDQRNPTTNITPVATRNIIMIRHGQYFEGGRSENDRILTDLGREQAELTARRLNEFSFPITKLIHSTMTRATETANIILSNLKSVPFERSELLEEGFPIPPIPSDENWDIQFEKDNARIETAFRTYFHRADPEEVKDSYYVLVCHGNVIRYLTCRALQLPAEAWLRMSINHCSLTWIVIDPAGTVYLRSFSDTGHLPTEILTS